MVNRDFYSSRLKRRGWGISERAARSASTNGNPLPHYVSIDQSETKGCCGVVMKPLVYADRPCSDGRPDSTLPQSNDSHFPDGWILLENSHSFPSLIRTFCVENLTSVSPNLGGPFFSSFRWGGLWILYNHRAVQLPGVHGRAEAPLLRQGAEWLARVESKQLSPSGQRGCPLLVFQSHVS